VSLGKDDSIETIEVFYDAEKINKIFFTTFYGAFASLGDAKSLSVETVKFQRVDNQIIGLYGSTNKAGEIVGISGLRDKCAAILKANEIIA
jgi:hypothetical protein